MRKKQLAIANMQKLDKIWIRGDKISEKGRLKLYNTLAKPVLTYKYGTGSLTKKEEQ